MQGLFKKGTQLFLGLTLGVFYPLIFQALAQQTESLIYEIGAQFQLEGHIISTEVHGNGNVNDTFLLFCEDEDSLNRYTLQRINHEVFKDRGLMNNFRALPVTCRLRLRGARQGVPPRRFRPGWPCLSSGFGRKFLEGYEVRGRWQVLRRAGE